MTRCSSIAERFVVLAAAASFSAACAAPAFREHGPRERDAGGGGANALDQRAWDRPRIEVTPPEVLAGGKTLFEVGEHTVVVDTWVLTLKPEAGESIQVRYRIADGMRLPIEIGEHLWFNQSSQGEGLVVREPEGGLRVVIAIDGQLAEALEGMVTPDFSADRLVYSEVIALPSGCVMVLDHHGLELRSTAQRRYVYPGSITPITVPGPAGDAVMRLYVFDASRPSPRRQGEVDPRCPPLAHVSWMALKAP